MKNEAKKKNKTINLDLSENNVNDKEDTLLRLKMQYGASKLTLIEQKNRPKLPSNVMVFQKFATMAALSPDLKQAELKIILYIIGIVRYENLFLSVDIANISEELQMTKRTVLRAMKKLKTMNILVSITNAEDKRKSDYAVNPTAMWKGNSVARLEKMKLMDKKSQQLNLFEHLPELPD